MTALRSGRALAVLPLAAVLALGTACSGGDSSDAAAGTTSAASSAATSSSSSSSARSSAAGSSSTSATEEERIESFCTGAPALLDDISSDLTSVQQAPQEAPQRLSDAVTKLQAVDPPAGVAPQWQRFVGAVTGLRDLVGKLDLANPQNNTQYAGELQALQPGLVDGGSAIDDWGKANC